MKWSEFLRTKLFFKQLLLMAIVSVAIFWLTIQLLKLYTRHGQFILLPDFVGKPLQELVQYADEKDLKVIVIDSLYDETRQPGTILVMDPAGNTGVKTGRKIYVTISSSTPDYVPMPNLRELSLRQAVETVIQSGLKIDYISYVPGSYFNSVAGQRIGSKTVRAGEMIPRNSKIVIMVEEGEGGSTVSVPDVIGLSVAEAPYELFRQGLNVGRTSLQGDIPLDSARVIQQQPGIGAVQNPGSTVSLVFGKIKNAKELDRLRKSAASDTTHQEPEF
jgi:beta-lactam-binding protein with PASTA domain